MRRRALTLSLASLALLTAACGGGGGAESTADSADDPTKVAGDITVLTNRTDLQEDGTLEKYAAQFKEAYPNVNVKFEALTDYEGEVRIRMNTDNYGDVLLVPNAVATGDYPKFFASLGDTAELAKKYRFTSASDVNGKSYGIVSFAAASGFVYNQTAWRQAGATDWPTSPQEFLSDLKAIKAKGDAIPLYTNYKDAWPITQWSQVLGAVSCDAGAQAALTTGDPWAPGADFAVGDGLLFDAVAQKLTEPDPTTTNWEESKGLLAKGKVGAMFLGSWAVPQIQAAAEAAGLDPQTIGFMPFPNQSNGKSCSTLSPDYRYAISTHSQNKDAARAWIDWLVDKSDFPALNEGVSPLIGSPIPPALKPFEAAGVTLIELDQSKVNQYNDIDKAAETGVNTPDYRQHLIDIARGAAKGDLKDALADLSKKWKDGQETVG
ncbi:extracellular solute-binding protein [Actinocorallia sp. API 0066]|uniref:ABC transporter substrate-binding protein n=1 Tax=Actinocorallia sp. API 0066 TaxID=2896846 RepID=UPI001E6359E9|nr:extracellular solute-binding protein [Actinocorallia sp. API 0066]MCD0449229.1 extracellular solute-binding protein [Actinocorallia sp. API 0066]